MKGFAIFIVASLAVHAGALLSLPEGGSQGQGAAGEDTLTLSAASEVVAAMVQDWDTPPETALPPTLTLTQPVMDTTAPLSPDAPVQPQTPAQLPSTAPEALPRISTPAPALNNPGTAISVLPSLQAPPLPGGFAPPNTTADAPPTLSAPDLTAPEAVTAPQPDTRPHYEGSTALATDASPRPQTRPNELAPPPPPAPAPQVAAPAPQPQQPRPQAPAPDRTAAGSGGGDAQGAAPQPAPQPAISQAQIQSAMAQWGGQIQSRIARSRPNVSGSGRAVVQLRVGRNGQLQGVGLARSSGNGAVDQAAINAVQRAGRFPRAPAALTNAAYTFSLPVSFQ